MNSLGAPQCSESTLPDSSRRSVIQIVLQVVSTILIVLYPLLIWAGITYGGIRWLPWGLMLIFILRLLTLSTGLKTKLKARAAASGMVWLGIAFALLGLGLSGAAIFLKSSNLLLFYPVFVSLLLLLLFATSLKSSMPMVERLARLQDPNLPPEAVYYTRKVTKIWCFFFIFNAGIALATCFYGDVNIWTLYNGFISYILIGMLMGGEWLVRKRIVKQSHAMTDSKEDK